MSHDRRDEDYRSRRGFHRKPKSVFSQMMDHGYRSVAASTLRHVGFSSLKPLKRALDLFNTVWSSLFTRDCCSSLQQELHEPPPADLPQYLFHSLGRPRPRPAEPEPYLWQRYHSQRHRVDQPRYRIGQEEKTHPEVAQHPLQEDHRRQVPPGVARHPLLEDHRRQVHPGDKEDRRQSSPRPHETMAGGKREERQIRAAHRR
jgi:hypothetical protein